MAMSEEGKCWVWGSNYHGQLGLGDTTDRHSPTELGGLWNGNGCCCCGMNGVIETHKDTRKEVGNEQHPSINNRNRRSDQRDGGWRQFVSRNGEW